MTKTTYPTQLYQSSERRHKKQLDALKRQVDRDSLIKRLEGEKRGFIYITKYSSGYKDAIDRCIQIIKKQLK